MARDQNSASESQTPEPGGYGKLAKRMATWTTNSLLTVMVLVIGIGFGRQVLVWWAEDEVEDPVPPLLATDDGLGDPTKLHVLEFGDLASSIQVQSLVGDQNQAISALRNSCRSVIASSAFPSQPADPAEIAFLAQIGERQPVAEELGKWQLFEITEKGYPMVVGTRQLGINLADPTHRVVTWGLAVPTGAKGWTLYTFQPGGGSGEGFCELPEFPLPPGCRKTLSLRVAGGGATIGFEGPQPAESWTQVYDDWFASRDWKTAKDWQRTGSTWYVRYTAPPGERVGWLDVRFGADANGRARGLLIVTPRNLNPKESEDL